MKWGILSSNICQLHLADRRTHDDEPNPLNSPRIGRAVIGRGRDAADVALTTVYGASELVRSGAEMPPGVAAIPAAPLGSPASRWPSAHRGVESAAKGGGDPGAAPWDRQHP